LHKLKVVVALAVEVSESQSYIILPYYMVITFITSNLSSLQPCYIMDMAGPNIYWLTFYGLPLDSQEALMQEILNIHDASRTRVLRKDISEVEVMAWLRAPHTVPKEYNIIVNNRMHWINIDVIDRATYLQRENIFLEDACKMLEQLRACI
jgi:hypothetical protein